MAKIGYDPAAGWAALEPVTKYIRLIARWHVEGDQDAYDEATETVWNGLTPEQKDEANVLSERVFAEYQ